MANPSAPPDLHPLLTHHVLNTLQWRSLRPLQKQSIPHILAGEHALLVAPTAGGKTEAAVFPVLSRMLEEDWPAISVLYLCPLRALLNNLHPRIEKYASLVGRRAGLWHGDVGESGRNPIRLDPPDILLTTPESVEAMLISRKTDHRRLFQNVRVLIVDEIHAFAGDDRGWHLLAVAERVQRIADHEIQRIGLSATVGNADDLLTWLTRSSSKLRTVVRPTDPVLETPEVEVDFVGTLDNAATVISRLHRGEKRLVFVDSRARVEELAVALRERDIRTFVSHGSLGREERHAAEQAFASARDCVIVATSTLELGIDVGDLDRVIQIDSPPAVASFLQRLGRTGRRENTTSNTLFLATRDDTLLQTLGLLRCWADGFVEPLEPEPLPLHLVVQQLLALVLQEGGVGRHTWKDWYGDPFVFGAEVGSYVDELTAVLLREDFLFEDNGILGIGSRGRDAFGSRNFMDLMAVFSEPPMMKVMAGRTEIGQVPLRLLTFKDPEAHRKPLLLAGRNWDVLDVDWRRGLVHVQPTKQRGRVRWYGYGRGLSFEICQGMKAVLAGADVGPVRLSRRAVGRLESLRDEFGWLREETESVLVRESGGENWWWTFAGATANIWLARGIGDLAEQISPGDLNIRLASNAGADQLRSRLEGLDPVALTLGCDGVAQGAIDRLKFAEALPDQYAHMVVERRMRNDAAVRAVASRSVREVVAGE